jgi:predicted Fe-Mo cluster-binding NifX family protein
VKKSTKKVVLASLAVCLLILLLFAFTGLHKTKRIAVAATAPTPVSTVDIAPGRAPFFLIFDEKGAFLLAIKNPYEDQVGGGISLVDYLANNKVTVIVAEDFGTRIVEVMVSKGIRPVKFHGTAIDAVKTALEPK